MPGGFVSNFKINSAFLTSLTMNIKSIAHFTLMKHVVTAV